MAAHPYERQNRLSLHHEAHAFKLRSIAYQKQVSILQQQLPSAQIKNLKDQIAAQQKQIKELEKQSAQTNQWESQTTQLAAQVCTLEAEIAELKERLGQDSHNSSLPPSSDSPFRKWRNIHAPSGRKQGAQPGHPGAGRKLLPIEIVDQIIELRPASCKSCDALLLGFDSSPARRQVAEIIDGQAFVKEYRQHRIQCLSCGAVNRENWSAEASAGTFGANVKAITVYLTGRLHFSHRDTVEALESLFKLKIGLGSISALQRRISNALAEPVAQAVEFVKQQSSQCVDETGWRENNQGKWMWVNSTENVTVFQIRQGRSQLDAQTIIDCQELGVVNTDRCPSYSFLQAWRRQLCWSHLLRVFIAISERDDAQSKEIGTALIGLTKQVFELYHRVRDGTLKHCRLRDLIEPIKKSVKELLESGVGVENLKTARTCQNILKHFRSLWTFVRVADVEPTNNRAERALRRAVLWRRKSFGTKSETGSKFVGRILTVVTTLRQQGRGVLEFLTAADRATTERVPLLLKTAKC